MEMVAQGEDLVGIKEYITDTEGIGGRLRKEAEDFRVTEISLPPPVSKTGNWTHATVTARNWETNRLIRMMSKRMHMSRDRIRFAGTKDKRAVSTQLMAFRAPAEMVQEFHMKDVTIENVFTSEQHIEIGDLIGNEFIIKVTDLDGHVMDRVRDTATQVKDYEGFPNYFGIQRFGVMRPVTHVVGKHMVRGQFDEAVMTYLGTVCDTESEEVQEIRQELTRSQDHHRALKRFPKQLSFERSMLQHLVNKKKDFVGALRCLPKNLLWMFVHAYQSHLFNLILSERLQRNIPLNTPIPGDLVITTDKHGLPNHDEWVRTDKDNIGKVTKQVQNGRAFVSGLAIGSGTDFAKGIQGEIERKVIEEEGLKNQDFIVPEMPEVTSTGIRRELLAPVMNLRYKEVEDGVEFSFKLNRGCYATCLMREFMKSDDIMMY